MITSGRSGRIPAALLLLVCHQIQQLWIDDALLVCHQIQQIDAVVPPLL
jgi:hypothetical protein